MAAHPEVVVDTAPAYALGNPATRAIVQAALARDYPLSLHPAHRHAGRGSSIV